MQDILTTLGVDPKLDKQGKWITWLHGIKLLVARLGNSNYHNRELSLMRGLNWKEVTAEQLEEIQNRCLAETVLLGWEGFDEFDGQKDFTYSPLNAYKLISDPRMALLRAKVIMEASSMENFAWKSDKDAAESLKNS